jgi:hypothetical protein
VNSGRSFARASGPTLSAKAPMIDLVLVALTAVSFAATYGLAVLCDRI